MPYTKNRDGHGPAWAKSLCEDHGGYGFGTRLAVHEKRKPIIYNIDKILKKGIDGQLQDVYKKAKNLWNKTVNLFLI